MWQVLLLGMALAGDPSLDKGAVQTVPERPACGKQNLGQMWPAEANGNPRLANQLAREGNLAICRKSDWRYSWRSPSVHIRQLAERGKRGGR